MSSSVWDFAPAIIAVIVAAFGLILVWLAVRQAHSEPGKRDRSRRRRPDPNAAE